MNTRWLFIIVVLLCVISGTVSGVFANEIQRALTVPSRHAAQPTTGTMPPTPVPTAPAAVLTPMPMIATILSQDTFQRPDRALWGTASDGRTWEGDANTQQHANTFFITNQMGVVMHGQGTFNALLGPVNANAEVMASASMSRFGTDNVNFGVVLRWTDAHHWYKALINGTQFLVLKRVGDVTTQLGMQPFIAQPNTHYTLRFRAIGATLFAKVWPSTAAEPAGWMVNVTDTSLTSGRGGIRVLVQNDVVVNVASFLETAAQSGV